MNATETKIVTQLIAQLDRHGYDLCGVRESHPDDPAITALVPGEVAKAIKNVDATGDGLLYFRSLGGQQRWVRLIVGNDIDIVSDYAVAPGGDDNAWNAAMNSFEPLTA